MRGMVHVREEEIFSGLKTGEPTDSPPVKSKFQHVLSVFPIYFCIFYSFNVPFWVECVVVF